MEDLDRVHRAVSATVNAPGQVLVAAEGRGDEATRVAQDAVVTDQPRSAAELPLSPWRRVEAIAIDLDAIDRLGDLDRQNIRLPIAEADETALAILVESRATAPAVQIDQDRGLAGVRVDREGDISADTHEVTRG